MFEENHTNFDLDDELLNSFEDNNTIKPGNTTINDDENRKFVKPQQIVKRKFPGPAGILPDCKNVDLSILYDNNDNHQITTNEIPCSQSSVSVFQDDLWLSVVNDYKQLMDEYSIDWIRIRANRRQLINQKAPFLAAIVQNLEYFEDKASIINVQLKDPTGTIQGTMINKLLDEYTDLSVGSVIVLQQFGVLTTGSNNNQYLTITPKNVVAIYTKNKQDNSVKTIRIQQINTDELIGKNRSRKRFNFKNPHENSKRPKLDNVTITNSQISVKTDLEHSSIWQDVFDGVDADALFDDF